MVTRCVIVGAGVIGTCLALRLAQHGADVTIVEADQPGYGATANSFAWVGASTPAVREPEPYFVLHARGVEAYRRLENECSMSPWLQRPGCLTWSTDPAGQEAIAANVSYLASRGYNAVLIDPKRARRDLDSAIGTPPSTQVVAFFPDEGYIKGPPFTGRILVHARQAGAVLRTGDRVTSIATSGSAVRGVTLSSGETLPADVVIVANGRGSAALLETVSFTFPLVSAESRPSAAVGLLVISRPMYMPIRRVLIADDIMFRPDGGGRLITHSFRIDDEVSAGIPVSPIPERAVRLMHETARHVQGAEQLEPEAARIGIRPLPADGLPAVGLAPGYDNLYMCVTHSGVTLAPLLAELLVDEILRETESPLLSSFRPTRFAVTSS